jgi:hypothetical protein
LQADSGAAHVSLVFGSGAELFWHYCR